MEKTKGLKNKQTKKPTTQETQTQKTPTTLKMKIYRYLIGKCIF